LGSSCSGLAAFGRVLGKSIQNMFEVLGRKESIKIELGPFLKSKKKQAQKCSHTNVTSERN